MPESTADFFTGDDLDDLFMLIDGDVALIEQIDAIAAEVASNENDITGFACIHCEKVCKTQRVLSRHTNINVRHANVLSTLSNETQKLSPTPFTPLEV